jgi:transposase
MKTYCEFVSSTFQIFFMVDDDTPQCIENKPSEDPLTKDKAVHKQDKKVSVLTELQRNLFEHWVRCSTSPQWLVIRCRIILALDDEKPKYRISREQRKDIKTVRKWAKRWFLANRELSKLEDTEITHKEYCERIIVALHDATRPGRPLIFTAEQVVQLIALACEVKDDSDEPTSHWTWTELAMESVKRRIFEEISPSSVGRFLKEAHIKPHLSRYWLNPQPENAEQFYEEIKVICDLYHNALCLYKKGIYLVSTDEKTGIQALEREHPTHPARADKKKAKGELREHNYTRHGTLCLIANFEVATGKIIAPTIGHTRKEEDFLTHIKKTVSIDPHGQWIFVTDQLNTHMSESLVQWVATQCAIEEDLGVKGQRGILSTMASRKAFLSDPTHRICFVYTPKHTSWMNQVEIWFSILTRRLLKRGSFSSVDHLENRIRRFIDFFNGIMAKPFKWTYKGTPLTV